MLADQYTTKGYGRWSDCSVVLRTYLTSCTKDPTKAIRAIMCQLYQLRATHVVPLAKQLQSLQILARPKKSDEAERAIFGIHPDPSAKGKSKAATDIDTKRHKLVAAACKEHAGVSGSAAAERLYLNLVHSAAGKGSVQDDAFGWSLLVRTVAPWRTVDDKSKARVYKRMANFAVFEESLSRSYRAQLVHSGNVLELRAKLRITMRRLTGQADWDFVDHHHTSSAPPAPTNKTDAQARKKARRKALKNSSVTDNPASSSDDDAEQVLTEHSHKSHEDIITKIMRYARRSVVASMDGSEGGVLHPDVSAALDASEQASQMCQ
jgi:hypothetical protein